ncbi:hypothetical protein MMC20_006672 [Loxospora ochrophaea]|nr:hypothetical protein [Loxospora ochrophaea]
MSGLPDGQPSRSSTSSPSDISALTFDETGGKKSSESRRASTLSTSVNGTYDQDSLRERNGGAILGSTTHAIHESSSGDHDESFHRKHWPRRSGGFLLSAPTLNKPQPTSPKVTGDGKDKGKAHTEDKAVQDTTFRYRRHRPKHSIGSSPLATEVTNARSSRDSPSDDVSQADEILQTNFKPHNDVGRASNSEKHAQQPQSRSAGSSSSKSFDTDSAQMVNLALNLSESRRRIASSGRLSPLEPAGSKRHFSSGHPSILATGANGSSLKQQLQYQRRLSRNISPRVDKLRGSGGASPALRASRETSTTLLPHENSGFDAAPTETFTFNPSDATVLRAEKARQSLELSYEYRRLLQHLPKLPHTSMSRPTTSKSLAKDLQQHSNSLGRTYNPLQYVRNRKIRIRERKTFDAEADGWRDLERVKNWIDSVAKEREDHVSKVDDRFPLPPFVPQKEGNSLSDQPSTLNPRPIRGQTVNRAPRPRMDWLLAPWDLLADAYWLEQDDHRKLIEDRDGNKLFRGLNEQYGALHRISQESTRPRERRSESVTRFRHSFESNSGTNDRERDNLFKGWRHREKRSDSTDPFHDRGGSQDRKNRWRRNILHSRNSSSSEDSRHDSVSSLKKIRGQYGTREDSDRAILEKQMIELLEKETNDSMLSSPDKIKDHQNVEKEVSSVDFAHDANDENVKTTGLSAKEKNPRKTQDSRSSSRKNVHERKNRKTKTSFDDSDATAPNSPASLNFVPTVAINLSPPLSRSASPVKPLPSKFLRSRLDHSKERHSTHENDFAPNTESLAGRFGQELKATVSYVSQSESTSSPNTSWLSPKSSEFIGKNIHRSSSKLFRGASGRGESHSRLRGFLKGGRIAEIVGNEVSRVGEFIWGKDGTHSGASSSASSFMSTASESEDEPLTEKLKKSFTRLSRATPDGEDGEILSRKSTEVDSPKYHINNLPSFKSTSKKDELSQISKTVPLEPDHISRQQLALKRRGRSSRFERLRPPRIDLRGISPSASPQPSPIEPHDGVEADDDSRRNSVAGSERDTSAMDRHRKPVLGLPPNIGHGGPPMTSLASADALRHRSHERLTNSDGRHWSISDRGVSAVRGHITRRDITRVRALLLSSGVKANEISRRAQETRDPLPPLLQDLQRGAKAPLPRVPRAQEVVLAARLLVKAIEETNDGLRGAADKLSGTTINELHDKIKAVDKRITSQLTPLVQQSADDADALSNELANTHRQSVQKLNNSMDLVVRRRRRRLRWIRRAGYFALEWTLLGMMWLIWLNVTIIRLVRAIIIGTYRSVRWLFWL